MTLKHVNGKIPEIAEFVIKYVTDLDLKTPVLLFSNTRGESEMLASILKEKSQIPIDLHHAHSQKKYVRKLKHLYKQAGLA